jgi:hypothetical protein
MEEEGSKRETRKHGNKTKNGEKVIKSKLENVVM